MQIIYHGGNNIEIKAKNVIVKTGEQIKVNDFILPGPGEYEIAGTEVYSVSDGVYCLRVEDVGLAYLDSLNRVLTEDEIKLLNDVAIVIIPVGGGSVLDHKKAADIVKAIEPQIVIPIEAQDYSEFCKLIGGCQDPIESYKVTKAQVSLMEGQTVVVLKPS